MKAIAWRKYGSPEGLELVDIPKPVPKDNELLIRQKATTVTSGDVRLRTCNPFFARFMTGIFRPTKNMLGVDISGVVKEIGKNIKHFKVGDEVFGSTYPSGGGNQEYIVQGENNVLAIKPKNLSFEEAAAIFFGGHTALHFLRKVNIKGKSILIYGASGCVGTYAIQLAKHMGAHVTGVCSTKNLKLIKELGAHEVIDYTKEDFSINNYDVIFDTVGKADLKKIFKSLNKNGTFLDAVHITFSRIIKSLFRKNKVIGGVATEHKKDLIYLGDLASKGIIKPIIDKTYPLEKIREAHAYVETGHKTGNVVVKI